MFGPYRVPMRLLRYDDSVEIEEDYMIECDIALIAWSGVFVLCFWGFSASARGAIEVGVVSALYARVSSGIGAVGILSIASSVV